MDRRNFVVGSLATFGLLSGCDNSVKSVKKITILGEDSSNLQAISKYLAGNPLGPYINGKVEATDFTTASNKAISAFTSKSNAYDVVVGYNFDLPRYANNHYILTVSELRKEASSSTSFAFEADILPNVWKELGYFQADVDDAAEPEAVAYPSSANTMIMVYNQAIFDDSRVARAYREKFGRAFSPPKTWEEFATVANLVAQANPSFKGVALQGAEGGWLYYEWMNVLFGMGGKTMEKRFGWQSTKKTPLALRTIEAARAAELYLSLKPANAGDFFSTDAVAQRDLMLAGKVGLAIAWTDYVPDFVKTGGFGFAPIPGDVSMIGGGSFFVNRFGAAKKESADLISNLLSPKAQKWMALNGLFPPTRSALSDPDVLAIPYMPAVKASLERGTYMLEAGVDATLISEKITQALQEAWRGDIAAETVGARATTLIEKQRSEL